ncbi:uncharacterized [Tachysurus ichikawai]
MWAEPGVSPGTCPSARRPQVGEEKRHTIRFLALCAEETQTEREKKDSMRRDTSQVIHSLLKRKEQRVTTQ